MSLSARQFWLTWINFIGLNFENQYHRRYLDSDDRRIGIHSRPLGVEFVLFLASEAMPTLFLTRRFHQHSSAKVPPRCCARSGGASRLHGCAHPQETACDHGRRARARARPIRVTWQNFIGRNSNHQFQLRRISSGEHQCGSHNHPLGVYFASFSDKRSYVSFET